MIFHLHRKCFHGTETVKVIRGSLFFNLVIFNAGNGSIYFEMTPFDNY